MKIIVDKVVGEEWMQEACKFTSGGGSTTMTLKRVYGCEHSPMRIQRFMVRMYDIPTFVSVHLVRHSVGVVHFVKSNREDRPGCTGDTGRMHPVNHMMDINAQALINMARKRLCSKAHAETIKVMKEIKAQVMLVDPDLAESMVRECEYRRGCHEERSCGYFKARWPEVF